MTLDEAIKHWEEKTEALYKAIPCDGCAFNECVKEHRQLAEWLKELKQLRKQTRWIPVGEEMPAADEDVRAHMDMLIAHKDKALKTHPYFNGVTNGDVIKAVFPNADCFEREIVNGLKYMTVWFADARISHVFDIDWWNAPYKGGEEDENNSGC